MRRGEKKRIWTADESAQLAEALLTDEDIAAIGALIGRSQRAVIHQAEKLGLPYWRRGEVMPESPKQSAAWSGVRFDDDSTATRPEPAWQRRRPPDVISACGNAAAMCVF